MRKSRSKTVERHMAINILIGVVFSLISIMVLLMIFSAFTSSGKIPENIMGAIVVGCCFISAIVGSRVTIKKTPERKLLAGAAQGAFLFILVFAIGKAASADAALGSITLGILIASLLGGTIGGYTGKKKKRRSIKR